jgi:hypothetical protein
MQAKMKGSHAEQEADRKGNQQALYRKWSSESIKVAADWVDIYGSQEGRAAKKKC